MEALEPLDFDLLRTSLKFFIVQKRFIPSLSCYSIYLNDF